LIRFQHKNVGGHLLIALLIFFTLGCSLISRLSSQNSDNALITRTPLPTFTLTPLLQEPIAILPTPTETAAPQPVAEQQEQPANPPEPPPIEPQPEPTSTETPEPPPPEAPPAPPPPAPTEPPPPPPPAEPAVGASGIIGKIDFRDGRNTYASGEKVFVRMELSTESGAGQKPFGILGLNTSTGAFQTSWSNGTINGTFTHEDGVAFNAPGIHKIWLSICYSSESVCQGSDGDWERFEPGLDVIIQ